MAIVKAVLRTHLLNGNVNVSWRRRAQIKQLAWAERQIWNRKSCLALSARFPVVNWRSRPVAKSADCKIPKISPCVYKPLQI